MVGKTHLFFYTHTPNIMFYLHSQKNGCTYTLSEDEDLLYHPMMKNGDINLSLSDYIYVDIECLDDDVAEEAFRCHNLLLESLEE